MTPTTSRQTQDPGSSDETPITEDPVPGGSGPGDSVLAGSGASKAVVLLIGVLTVSAIFFLSRASQGPSATPPTFAVPLERTGVLPHLGGPYTVRIIEGEPDPPAIHLDLNHNDQVDPGETFSSGTVARINGQSVRITAAPRNNPTQVTFEQVSEQR